MLEKVNFLTLLVTIPNIMARSNLLSNIAGIKSQFAWLITFITSLGLFRFRWAWRGNAFDWLSRQVHHLRG